MALQAESSTTLDLKDASFKAGQKEQIKTLERSYNSTHTFNTAEHGPITITPPKLKGKDEKGSDIVRELVFLSLTAEKYDFKDECGKTKFGFEFSVDESIWHFLDSPALFVKTRIQSVTATKLKIRCSEKMFSKPGDKLEVVATFGTSEWKFPRKKPGTDGENAESKRSGRKQQNEGAFFQDEEPANEVVSAEN